MRAMSAMDSRSGRKPARRFRCTYWLRFSTAASGDGHRHALRDGGRQRRARHLQPRHAHAPVDEEIVQEDVHDVGDRVVEERGLGISRAAQRVGDGRRQREERQAQHLDLQVLHAAQQRLLVLRAHEQHQRMRKRKAQHREEHGQDQVDHQRLAEDELRLVLPARALVARDHGHAAHVERGEHRREQELGLRRQPNGRDGPRPELPDHDQVRHARQLRQQQLHQRRPRDAHDVRVELARGHALGQGDLLPEGFARLQGLAPVQPVQSRAMGSRCLGLRNCFLSHAVACLWTDCAHKPPPIHEFPMRISYRFRPRLSMRAFQGRPQGSAHEICGILSKCGENRFTFGNKRVMVKMQTTKNWIKRRRQHEDLGCVFGVLCDSVPTPAGGGGRARQRHGQGLQRRGPQRGRGLQPGRDLPRPGDRPHDGPAGKRQQRALRLRLRAGAGRGGRPLPRGPEGRPRAGGWL